MKRKKTIRPAGPIPIEVRYLDRSPEEQEAAEEAIMRLMCRAAIRMYKRDLERGAAGEPEPKNGPNLLDQVDHLEPKEGGNLV